MPRLYHHEVRNIEGADIGAHVDLSKVVAVGPIHRATFEVTLAGRSKLVLYALNIEDRERFVSAWADYLAQEEA